MRWPVCCHPCILPIMLLMCLVTQPGIMGQGLEKPNKLPIRLVGGPNALIGRVEVQYNGTWGTVCDDNFDLHDAHVICHQMGFVRAISIFPNGQYKTSDMSAPTWIDELRCRGDEKNLLDCEFDLGQHDCHPKHREDTGVRCYVPRGRVYRIPSLPVRFRGGSDMEGYLQVFYRNRWGLVGAEGWSQLNSKVVCGQMGYCGAEETRVVDETSSHFNFSAAVRGDRPFFWMKGVSCLGGEALLKDCRHFDFKAYYRLPAAKVRCLKTCETYYQNGTKQPARVRLSGGALRNEGRLEILLRGRWGTVCGTFFFNEAATIACREMGFGSAIGTYKQTPFGRGSGYLWVQEVSCRGNEGSLHDCNLRVNERPENEFYTSCRHIDDASLKCRVPRSNNRLRLTGGANANEGYLKIRHRGQWGILCKSRQGQWTRHEAKIACRALGLGYAVANNIHLPPPKIESTSPSDITHWIIGMKCTGEEDNLHACAVGGKTSYIGAKFCPDGAATLRCSKSLPDLVPDMDRLRRTISSRVDRQSLFRLRCAVEENCLANSVYSIPHTHFRQYHERRLLRFSSRIMNRGTADFLPSQSRDQWQWHSCHMHYHSFEEFTHYNITNAQGKLMVEGHKASFCLEDVECDGDVAIRYQCVHGHQGISKNCADVYRYDIDCQWVDVTDLQSGIYTLILAVNPTVDVAETDYSNNVAWCRFRYTRSSGTVAVLDCGLRGH